MEIQIFKLSCLFMQLLKDVVVTPERLLSIHPHLSELSQENHGVHTCIPGVRVEVPVSHLKRFLRGPISFR